MTRASFTFNTDNQQICSKNKEWDDVHCFIYLFHCKEINNNHSTLGVLASHFLILDCLKIMILF